MQRPIVVALSLLLCLQSVVSFLPPTPLAARPVTAPTRSRSAGAVQMNGVTDAIQSYVGIWSPTIRTYVIEREWFRMRSTWFVLGFASLNPSFPLPYPSIHLALPPHHSIAADANIPTALIKWFHVSAGRLGLKRVNVQAVNCVQLTFMAEDFSCVRAWATLTRTHMNLTIPTHHTHTHTCTSLPIFKRPGR